MPTTLAIDDDGLDAAKAISRRDRRSAGEVMSEIGCRAPEGTRNRVPLLDARPGVVVTPDVVERLRDGLA